LWLRFFYLSLLVTATIVPRVSAESYTEDFTTTVYKDTVRTIADWNTSYGALRLFTLPAFAGAIKRPASR